MQATELDTARMISIVPATSLSQQVQTKVIFNPGMQ